MRPPVGVLPFFEGVGVEVAVAFVGPEGTPAMEERVGVDVRVAVVLPPPPAGSEVAIGVGAFVASVCVSVAVLLLSVVSPEETAGSFGVSGVGVSEFSTMPLPDTGVGVSCVSDGDEDGLEGSAAATDVAVWLERTMILIGFSKEVRLKITANTTAAATVPTNVNQVDGDEEKIQLRPLLLATGVVSGNGGLCVGARRCAN